MKIWRRWTSYPCRYLGKMPLGRSNTVAKALRLAYVWPILGTLRRSLWLEWNDRLAKYQFVVFLPPALPSVAWLWKIPGKESDRLNYHSLTLDHLLWLSIYMVDNPAKLSLLETMILKRTYYRRLWADRATYPWRRKWQPTLVFLPGKSHGQRSLVAYKTWGCKSQTRLSA